MIVQILPGLSQRLRHGSVDLCLGPLVGNQVVCLPQEVLDGRLLGLQTLDDLVVRPQQLRRLFEALAKWPMPGSNSISLTASPASPPPPPQHLRMAMTNFVAPLLSAIVPIVVVPPPPVGDCGTAVGITEGAISEGQTEMESISVGQKDTFPIILFTTISQ